MSGLQVYIKGANHSSLEDVVLEILLWTSSPDLMIKKKILMKKEAEDTLDEEPEEEDSWMNYDEHQYISSQQFPVSWRKSQDVLKEEPPTEPE